MTETACIKRAGTYWTTCGCANCVRLRARRRKLHYVGHQWRISQEDAWAIVAAKFEAGWTARALGSATRLDPPGTVNGRLYFSRHMTAWRRGEQVLIGPTVAAVLTKMGTPTEGQVGAEPFRRRLRALAAIGHGLNTLAVESGISFSTLAMIRRGNVRVSAQNARAIAAMYDRLHMTPGNDDQAQRIAREKRWPAPLAWDDIDSLNERPSAWRHEADDRSDTLRELADMGLGITEACRRLDLSRDAVEKWCARRSMSDVYRRLAAREAVRGNQHSEGAA